MSADPDLVADVCARIGPTADGLEPTADGTAYQRTRRPLPTIRDLYWFKDHEPEALAMFRSVLEHMFGNDA